MSINLEGASCEEESARLLPWFVTGRLSTADVERVTSHLERCAICRHDLEEERALRQAVKSDGRIGYAPQAGLARTLARIDELGREPALPSLPLAQHKARPARRRAALQWLAAAVVVQAIGLGLLGAALFHRAPSPADTPRYETLASDPAPLKTGPRIRAVFAPATTLAELDAMLAAARLTIVRGPTGAGAFTLAATDAQLTRSGLDAVIAGLRADSRVLFCEPVVAEEAPTR